MATTIVEAPARSSAPSLDSRLRRAGDRGIELRLARNLGAAEIAWSATLVPGWCTLLLAATRDGVCQLELLSARTEVDESLARLRARNPGRSLRRDDDLLDPLTAQASRYLCLREDVPLRLPLDAPGTGFQREVWAALCEIPPGRTLTYAQVAEAIGRPARFARAVGSAVGANCVSLAVPCHRVLAAGGALGGFRWGTDVKLRLLTVERSRRRERETPRGRRRGGRC